VAVQCTYFEKSSARNWLVPLHQDLSIPVAERVDECGWSGWSEKEGVVFVQAPVEVLEQLVAVRLHLDRCGSSDGPLRVVPGSHSHGVLAPAATVAVRDAVGECLCEAEVGTALVMRPLLLHASSKSLGTGRRRVLHFLYGSRSLPHGLRWQTTV
jgi:ectoine hydroxylase-related dioxygenase (phytanoyl-CoA dioxygenase family)